MADPEPFSLADILKPGSSLHPQFLLVVDLIFAFLFFVLVGLVILTAGNLHFFALIAIEVGLWVSVKWFVNELKNTPEESKKES